MEKFRSPNRISLQPGAKLELFPIAGRTRWPPKWLYISSNTLRRFGLASLPLHCVILVDFASREAGSSPLCALLVWVKFAPRLAICADCFRHTDLSSFPRSIIVPGDIFYLTIWICEAVRATSLRVIWICRLRCSIAENINQCEHEDENRCCGATT